MRRIALSALVFAVMHLQGCGDAKAGPIREWLLDRRLNRVTPRPQYNCPPCCYYPTRPCQCGPSTWQCGSPACRATSSWSMTPQPAQTPQAPTMYLRVCDGNGCRLVPVSPKK